MKEHPVLFNTAMIRAIRAGIKTQTRRPMNPQPTHFVGGVPFHGGRPIRCPFGVASDRLWCRETFVRSNYGNAVFFADFMDLYGHFWESIASNPKDVRWHPSIHMLRSLCKTMLDVNRVWPERVQDISEEDARAEGVNGDECVTLCKPFFADQPTASMCFANVWESIYGKRGQGWDANPWVWAADFKEVKP